MTVAGGRNDTIMDNRFVHNGAWGAGVATAWTRNGKDWSDKFKALVKAAAKLPAGCLVDGEAVAIDDKGEPSFQLLQATLKDRQGANLVYYAFDLLIDRSKDIRKLPNIERKERLAALLEGVSPPILYGGHFIGRGEAMFNAMCEQGGEGIVSKKASAPYSGTRTRNWLKIKCIQRQEFVHCRLVRKRQAHRLPLTCCWPRRRRAS